MKMNGGKSWLDNMVESVELRDGICRIEFLEEEGLITFDYSLNPFAGGYLKVKEVEKKERR